MVKLTEKEIKKLCKKAGCHCPPYNEILGKYADTPEYLRQYIEGLGKKELFDKIKNKCSLWDTSDIRGSSETKSGDKWLSMDIVNKLEKKLLGKE